MRSVSCSHCNRDIPIPDDAEVGKVYGCPHCKQALPPVPAMVPVEELEEDRPRRKRRDWEEDIDPGRKPPLSPLSIIGWILFGFGALIALGGLGMDTTVSSGLSYDRIYNLGKLNTALCLVVVGVGMSIVGAIFVTAPPRRE